MGDKFKNIILGGARVYNVEKAGIKKDKHDKPIYCVWLKGGAYAEYPEQTNRYITSYYAIDKKYEAPHIIDEKVFKSNKTVKDGIEYTFEKKVEEYPVLYSEKRAEYDGKEYYEQVVNGFNGIRLLGSENPDGIFVSNTSNAEIVTDNDTEKDGINILVNCKKIKYQLEAGNDIIARWLGYDKKNGYSAKYNDK